MNYSIFVVKIIEKPIKHYFKKNIFALEIKGQFFQIRGKKNKKTIRIFVWGNLASEILNYSQINKLIIVEGYISLHPQFSKNQKPLIKNEVQISARKVYSFP